MLYVLVALSLLFVLAGFLITEKTAPYLLSGYNTMSAEERKKFDLKSFLNYFRKFQWFLGLSLLSIGLPIYYLTPGWLTPFISAYPLLAFAYFLLTSRKYYQTTGLAGFWIGIAVLLGALVLVSFIMIKGMREDNLFVKEQTLFIEGQYGETIPLNEIATIELVEQVPEMASRTNGFSTGSIKKGHFKTAQGENVKLVLNGPQSPMILIYKKSGGKIFFSSSEKSNKDLFKSLSSSFRQEM